MDNTFDNQIIFKLATIETQVRGISENLAAAVHRLEDKIAETHQQQTAAHVKLESRVDGMEGRLGAIEAYKNNLTAKVGGIVSVVAIFWMLFGTAIEQRVGQFF